MKRSIILTPNEILSVESFLRDKAYDNINNPLPPVSRELILRLGGEIDTAQDVVLTLEEEDIWLLREIIPIHMKDSYGKAIGLGIKKKLYNLLKDIQREEMTGDIDEAGEYRDLTKYELYGKSS